MGIDISNVIASWKFVSATNISQQNRNINVLGVDVVPIV